MKKLFEKKVNYKSPNSNTGLSSFQTVESENKYGNEQKRIRNHGGNLQWFPYCVTLCIFKYLKLVLPVEIIALIF